MCPYVRYSSCILVNGVHAVIRRKKRGESEDRSQRKGQPVGGVLVLFVHYFI